MALLNINGVDIKTPSKYQVLISDIDGLTTRNAQGNLIRDRVAIKRKIEMEFPPLTQAQCSTLLTAVQDVFFSVTFLDPKDGVITKTMYVGDRTMPMLVYGNGSAPMWEGLKMNFIEQ